MIMNSPGPVFENIWLADDDPDDRELFEDVLRQLLPLCRLTSFKDGEELMNALSPSNKPEILFLDINMPKKNGLDCLVEIRAQRHFSRLPIVIFSSARETKFMDSSYGYGANLYFSKPTSFNELIAGLSRLLRMDWNDPLTITSDHFVGNKFVAYNAATFN